MTARTQGEDSNNIVVMSSRVTALASMSTAQIILGIMLNSNKTQSALSRNAYYKAQHSVCVAFQYMHFESRHDKFITGKRVLSGYYIQQTLRRQTKPCNCEVHTFCKQKHSCVHLLLMMQDSQKKNAPPIPLNRRKVPEIAK